MGQTPSFAEILEGKLGNSEFVRATTSPIDAPFRSGEFDSSPAHLAYLLGQIAKPPQDLRPRKSPYPRPPARPVQPHILNDLQTKALSFFTHWGEVLTPAFSKGELKSAFRRLAKKLHPDLSQRSGSEFIELKEAFSQLNLVPRK
jgi:hypothetical protein